MLTELNTIAKNYEYLIKAVGAFLPFLIAIFMAYIAYQQWQTNERKRQQDLFNLRVEHIQFLYKKWTEINFYIKHIPSYKTEIIVKDSAHASHIRSSLEKLKIELSEHNIMTKALFDNAVQELEEKFIISIITIGKGLDFTVLNITDSYKVLEENFNDLYKTYSSFLQGGK